MALPASPRVSAAAVFELAASIERLPPDLRLHSLEWGVLFAVTGRHTVGQIGAHLELSDGQRDGAFSRLIEAGLIAERPVTAREYLRAASLVPGGLRTLAEFLTAGLAGPQAEPVAEPRPAEAASARPALTETENNGFEPLSLPEEDRDLATSTTVPPVPQTPLSMSLRSVMRFVSAQAKEKEAGQLDVYRTFVRVSPRLLRRNGITTLRFEDDRLVSDPELQAAILTSVRQVVGKDCPPEVFVRG